MLPATLVALLAIAAPATASTVSLTADADLDYTLTYQAAPGEANDVNVSTLGSLASGGWLVYDAAPLTAGETRSAMSVPYTTTRPASPWSSTSRGVVVTSFGTSRPPR